MKSYLTENWSTVFLIAVVMLFMAVVPISSRGFGDPLSYLAFVIPALLLGGGVYGWKNRSKGKAADQ